MPEQIVWPEVLLWSVGVFVVTLLVTLLVNGLLMSAAFSTEECAPPVWEVYVGLVLPSWQERRNRERLQHLREEARERYRAEMRADWKTRGWQIDEPNA